MRSCLVFGGFLVAACAGRYSEPVTIRTSTAPQETFECVKQQMTALGYRPASIDEDELRINGNKIDTKSRRPDSQFRRVIDKLEVDVSPEGDGRTSVLVQGRTFAEYTTQRGPTEVEESASDEVKTATQRLLEHCRG